MRVCERLFLFFFLSVKEKKQLQSLRAVAIDKLFPFLFAPIGNGKPVDGQKRSFLLVLDDTDFAVLFRKLSSCIIPNRL